MWPVSFQARAGAARNNTTHVSQAKSHPRTRLERVIGSALGRGVRFLDLRPLIAQGDGAIEDEACGPRIRIDSEVAEPLELIEGARGRMREAWFDLAAGQHLER